MFDIFMNSVVPIAVEVIAASTVAAAGFNKLVPNNWKGNMIMTIIASTLNGLAVNTNPRT